MSSSRKILAAVIIAACLVAAFVFVSWRARNKPPVAPVFHPWIITTDSAEEHYGTFLGNGFVAARIGNDGWGSMDGDRLPSFMAGLYSNETLAELPHWSSVEITGRSGLFSIDKRRPYEQSLDMRKAQVRTSYSARSGRDVVDVEALMFVSRVRPSLAVTLFRLTPRRDMQVSVGSSGGELSGLLETLDTGVALVERADRETELWACVKTGDNLSRVAIASRTVPPTGLRAERRELSKGSQALGVDLNRDQTYTFVKYTAITRTENRFENPLPSALRTLKAAQEIGFSALLSEHEAAWGELWRSDIRIQGDPEAQQVVRSCMFYLLQNVREGSDWSIPPTGLSSTAWNGHVFWDADTWMFPSLLPQHPQLAKSIVDYRYKTLSGARANARKRGLSGVEYAWESARSGKETIGPPFSEERHINADVALAQWQYYQATGDRDWLRRFGYPILSETANYWVSRVHYDKAKDRYEILRVTPPDEIVEIVDNSVYTNAAARRNLEVAIEARRVLGRTAPQSWVNVAKKMYLPFDEQAGRYIEYDGYRGERTKQADTELLIYPLEMPMPDEVAERTFDYYKMKTLENGPAMSSSVHAVIAARMGRQDEAFEHFRKSYRPFLRGPFNMFNEKRSKFMDITCFVTAAGGTLQSVIYGFGGLNMSEKNIDARPLLPKEWGKLEVTNIKWQGKTYDLVVDQNGHRLRNVSADISSKNIPKTNLKVASPH